MRLRTETPFFPRPWLGVLLLATLLLPSRPAFAERLCDPAAEDCRSILLSLIRAETVRLDVAFWFMEDKRYVDAIIQRHRAGVPVRVLVDTRANSTYPANRDMLALLQKAGVPMRRKVGSGILHWKMMLFAGQNTVEFSGANYSPFAFLPIGAPYTNYIDEVIYFATDPKIVDSFKTRFDDLWTDTKRYANYANVNERTRAYPESAIDPELNFPPSQDYALRSVRLYERETQQIDAIMYRITDRDHTDALIEAMSRGVKLRLITEQQQYRDPTRLWHSWNVDRLYAAGAEIRHRAHQGLNHQKSVLLRSQRMSILGSSNWTGPSAHSQEEHNYFTRKAWIFDWLSAQFERKWNNLTGHPETQPFQPLPPGRPTLVSPANGGAAPPLPTLVWHGGPFAHRYDVRLGTSPSNMQLIVNDVELGPSLNDRSHQRFTLTTPLAEGTTYYWQVVSRTMANLTTEGPIWSFTVGACGSPVLPQTETMDADGGTGTIDITLPAGCGWRAQASTGWIAITSQTSGAGSAKLSFRVDANTSRNSRVGSIVVNGIEIVITQDGVAPPPVFSYVLAEGATGPFFDYEIAIANPNAGPAFASVELLSEQGTTHQELVELAPRSRTTVRVEDLPGFSNASASALITAEGTPLIVERSMFWDDGRYGGHGAMAVEAMSRTWYFAEGAQGVFDTYLLLANPATSPVDVTVDFLREGASPVQRTFTIAPQSRFTVDVSQIPELANRSFASVVTAEAPIAAERAMYFGQRRLWEGGHSTAGVTAPARSWFFAGGATGAFFDTYLLVANPNASPASVEIEYLLPSGDRIVRGHAIPARRRLTVLVDTEDPRLADTAVSAVVRADVPIVAERAMYWPGGPAEWREANGGAGLTSSATRWGLAEGRVGGALNYETYILIANPSSSPANVRVLFLLTDGSTVSKNYTVAAGARFNVHVNSMVPEIVNEEFGAVVESTNGVPIAVERAMYWGPAPGVWEGGSSVTAMQLP